MDTDTFKLNILHLMSDLISTELKEECNKLQHHITLLIEKNETKDIDEILFSFLKILKFIINEKLEQINKLKPVEFSFIERLFVDFLWLDMRIFKSGNNLYKDICNLISGKKPIEKVLFLSDFLKGEIESLTGLREYFQSERERKEYEQRLFKLEDDKNKLAHLREQLLFKIQDADEQIIRKYITQSTKLEQEIPHIAEYNFKRSQGITITPTERNNLIRLEKEIDEDNEWRDTIISNFIKTHPDIVYEIKKINKAIETILKKEGEIIYNINIREKSLQEFQLKDKILNEDDAVVILQKISSSVENIVRTYSSEYFLPVQSEGIILNMNFYENLETLLSKEEKFIKYLHTRKKEFPEILLLPFINNSYYLKENNKIIVPLYAQDISVLYEAYALFKWNADSLHNVKTEYSLLKQNRGFAPEIIEKKFIEKYVLFFNEQEKFKESENTETYQFFEKIFK